MMLDSDSILGKVAAANPNRATLSPAAADDDQLQAILDMPRDAHLASSQNARVGGPGRRRAAAVGLTAAAAAVGLVYAVVVSPTNVAFADWTETPRAITTTDLSALDRQCDASAPMISGANHDEVTDVPVEPVLSEARGPYLYRVSTTDNAYAECFITMEGENPVVVGSAAVLPEPFEQVGSRDVVVYKNGTSSWSSDDDAGTLPGELTSALGQAGPQISSITVTTSAGEQVSATVSNGWWAVWVPQADSISDVAMATLHSGEQISVDITYPR